MSRIPQVRPWRVRYWDNEHKLLAEYTVQAPTALFAKWAAMDCWIASGTWRNGPALPSQVTTLALRTERCK